MQSFAYLYFVSKIKPIAWTDFWLVGNVTWTSNFYCSFVSSGTFRLGVFFHRFTLLLIVCTLYATNRLRRLVRRQSVRQTDRESGRQTESPAGRQRVRQADRQRVTQTDRESDKYTVRQKDIMPKIQDIETLAINPRLKHRNINVPFATKVPRRGIL